MQKCPGPWDHLSHKVKISLKGEGRSPSFSNACVWGSWSSTNTADVHCLKFFPKAHQNVHKLFTFYMLILCFCVCVFAHMCFSNRLQCEAVRSDAKLPNTNSKEQHTSRDCVNRDTVCHDIQKCSIEWTKASYYFTIHQRRTVKWAATEARWSAVLVVLLVKTTQPHRVDSHLFTGVCRNTHPGYQTTLLAE